MNKVLFSSHGMDWATPQNFFDELNKEFHFTLDPCCLPLTAKCKTFFTPKEDGLKQSWKNQIVFMNPPYGREISKWVEKAYTESIQGGVLVVCLLPARTDTQWWWNYCMKGEIRFVKGRLKFSGKNIKGEYVNNSATFPSAVVIFRPNKKGI